MKRSYQQSRQDFEPGIARGEPAEVWKAKFLRFLRYLSTRSIECWGFFAAGFILAKIF